MRHKSPEINIDVTKEKDNVFIKVTDNGIGLDKEEAKNIFNKFYCAPTGNIHNVKGQTK